MAKSEVEKLSQHLALLRLNNILYFHHYRVKLLRIDSL